VPEINTKKQIVELATELMRLKSYNSFSYHDIAKEVGVKKPSIHYYFQTKDVLGVEVIKNYRAKIEYLMTKLENLELNPIEKLEAYFNFFEKGLKQGLICPGGVLSIEFNTLNKEMQDELRSLFELYITWLIQLLEEGKKLNFFKFKGSSHSKAVFIASTIEGALILSRPYIKTYHFLDVINQIKESLQC
jgi:TetR/AcrR family transcriptional regulator, transcriptional repressor for nem operon